MGLETSHDCWHGAYSSFSQWRHWLAAQIGVDLDSMQGFGGGGRWVDVESGLVPLLDHSDCYGQIMPDDAARIADALDAIAENANPADEWEISRARQFSAGCRLAAEANEHIHFH